MATRIIPKKTKTVLLGSSSMPNVPLPPADFIDDAVLSLSRAWSSQRTSDAIAAAVASLAGGSFAPLVHNHQIAEVIGLPAALAGKQPAGAYATAAQGALADSAVQPSALAVLAPLNSPALTGAPSAPTPLVADNGPRLATTAFVQALIAQMIDTAPGVLNTFAELAAAMGNDPAFATTVMNALAGKADLGHGHTIPQVAGLAAALAGLQPAGSYAAAVHPHAQADVTGLVAALAALAPLASPTLTGTPTAPTAAGGDNSLQIANTAWVQARIAAILASAPATLDTLNELAAALGNDANFATTITTLIAGKSALGHNHPAADIADSTVAGRALLTAATAADQRTALQTPSVGLALAMRCGQPQF